MELIDIRTPFERARDEKHARICNDYRELTAKMPSSKPYRLMRALGEAHGMTTMGIREVLVRNGLFKNVN